MPSCARRCAAASQLGEEVQHGSVGAVADGVDADRETEVECAAKFGGHLGWGGDADPAVVGFGGLQLDKGGQHPGSAAAQAAIGKNFDMAQPQVVVAKARTQAQGCQMGQVVCGHIAGNSLEQVAGLAQPQQAAPLARAVVPLFEALGVQCGDAQPVQGCQGSCQRGILFGGGGKRDPAGYQVDGLFAQQAGQPAVGGAVEERVGWRSGLVCEPGDPQRRRIGHGAVQVAAVKQSRSLRPGHAVELGSTGEMGFAPPAFVPTVAYNPVPWPGCCCGDPFEHLGAAACAGQLHPVQAQCVLGEMEMGVAEAGQQQPTAQVDQGSLGASQGQRAGRGADGQDLLAVDRDCLGPGLAGFLGIHSAVVQDQTGRAGQLPHRTASFWLWQAHRMLADSKRWRVLLSWLKTIVPYCGQTAFEKERSAEEQHMKSIPNNILEMPVQGIHLTGTSLRQELGTAPTLLVFLRHFG
jgi:hypothetical protein